MRVSYASPGRKGIDTSLIWPRTFDTETPDYLYNAVGAVDTLYGLLIYLSHKGLIRDYFPPKISREIEKYYKVEKDSKEPIINDRYCYRQESNMFKGTVNVKAMSNDRTHIVNVSGVPHKSVVVKIKSEAIRYMSFACDCDDWKRRLHLTAPLFKRKKWGDYRRFYDVPSPVVDMVMCKDANAAMHFLVEERNCESYDFWGLNGQAIEFLQSDISKVLRTKRTDTSKLPKYEVNEYLLVHTDFFKPLLEWIEKT